MSEHQKIQKLSPANDQTFHSYLNKKVDIIIFPTFNYSELSNKRGVLIICR